MANRDLQDRGRALLSPLVAGLARTGISPTAITLVGLALHFVGGIVVGIGEPRLAALVLLIAGVCDALDGQLARRTGQVTRFGAFLDSNVDRIEETAVLAGIAAFFQTTHWPYANALIVSTLLALGGSLITSYARARAEGLGLDCKVGWFERPHRVAVVLAGLLVGPRGLAVAIPVVLVLSWVTVLQRIHHVHRVSAEAPGGGAVVPPPASGSPPNGR
jgi:CDP-diacylglycerol--glycerol-3-phosphate 3-phosphatidyltransferase